MDEDVEKLSTVNGIVNGATTIENSMEVPLKIKTGTTVWSSNSTSGYIPKEMKIETKRYFHIHVYSSIIHSSQKAEETQVSIDEYMDKQNVVYVHNGILFSLKKE